VTIKKELLEIPQALRQMYEEGRPLYDAVIRGADWRERPIFIVGNNSSYLAALSGAWAFESLLGLPVIVRRPAVFSAYTRRALAVRSLVMAVSGSAECEETLQAARNAKTSGAIVWAITTNPASELANLANAVVNCYAGESPAGGSRSVFCRHAVMLFLAVAAARVLKAPDAMLNAHEEELGKLARHVEWVLNQISDAASALANELGLLPRLYIVGGGPFHPVAVQAASRLRQLASIRASGYELMHFQQALRQGPQPGRGILYLSSSRSKLKEQVHHSVRESRQKGDPKIFAITDNNDRQLSQRAGLAVLLPALTEPGAALLALAFLELATHYAAQSSAPVSGR
jgi:glutamine---fructose-6-phosphate transaminase (isomerizing)